KATRDKSVFGTAGETETTSPLLVHWLYFGDPWLNELHKEKITRFWGLYLERRGGRLATFSGDLRTALQGFCQSTSAPAFPIKRWVVDEQQNKIEMLRISRNVEITDWITRDALPEPAPRPPETMVGALKIGIRWKSNIDLDLYATP